jgi:hypothetical protein
MGTPTTRVRKDKTTLRECIQLLSRGQATMHSSTFEKMYHYLNQLTGMNGCVRADVEWNYVVEEHINPRQRDGWNCGVFSAVFIECCLKRALNRLRLLDTTTEDYPSILSTCRYLMIRQVLANAKSYRDASPSNQSPVELLRDNVTIDDLTISALTRKSVNLASDSDDRPEDEYQHLTEYPSIS